MRTMLVLLVLLGSPLCVGAEQLFGDTPAVVRKVVDGDTLVVDIPDYPPLVGHAIGVRVAGCDTPEKRDSRPELQQRARSAHRRTKQLATPGTTIMLRNLRRDKYFRILADVETEKGDLARILIDEGLALPYNGGTKQW